MTWHGVLPIYKPRGMTSHDVVGRIRRIAGQKRVGHTGTLDPEVEGVLPICLGQGTRVVEYIQDLPKRYRGRLKLGITTDTEDQTGMVTEDKPLNRSLMKDEIDHVFSSFLGEIEQIPPMYSAVRVQGKRLYDLAREGKVVERKPRKATIYELTCIGFQDGEYPEIEFDVLCSKGTYVRTLCVDIGKAWDTPSHMTSLTRVESGSFQSESCFTLEEVADLQAKGRLDDALVPIGEAISHFPSLIVSEQEGCDVLDGKPIRVDQLVTRDAELIRVYTEAGRFCAIYRLMEDGVAKPEKVFRDVE
ncbi:tRNA pseudouridine55 synthase [Thermoactinomyces sp. DSM 45891]|uniref:tRNA pseudouridine(55) synthase TruB n=1 Tax=Thermoactinomyces sp. DSM 45891 TaxID=1761907 RepID=UPI0009201CDA|nr:tRNA pseudouridine(55) synthase TruB [Thermoactinomyces sp. DSM 45891]SFX35079.1 tRNA pseudouridine55 synthase [Thermoactinomyces sp. DSM 45891]